MPDTVARMPGPVGREHWAMADAAPGARCLDSPQGSVALGKRLSAAQARSSSLSQRLPGNVTLPGPHPFCQHSQWRLQGPAGRPPAWLAATHLVEHSPALRVSLVARGSTLHTWSDWFWVPCVSGLQLSSLGERSWMR